MFNAEHLGTLQAVVEEGTVLAAADRLGCTPSAVSQQLGRLQREVSRPLMTRRGRSNVPTEAATVLVRLAQQVRDLDERARAELEGLDGEVSGSMVLSGFPTAVRGLLIPAAVDLRRRHPGLELTLREMSPHVSVTAVRRGEVDLAVVHDWTDRHVPLQDGVQVWPIGLDPVAVVLPQDHGVRVGPDGVDLDDLGGRVWIDDTPGVFSDWLLEALDSRRLRHRIGATVEHLSGRLTLVAEGFGICLLPRLGRDDLPPGVVALPLVGAPTRRIQAVHRDAGGRRPAVEAALDVLRDTWRERVGPANPPTPGDPDS